MSLYGKFSTEHMAHLQKLALDPQDPQQEQPHPYEIPWKGIGLGLLGAAGAYGVGKYNPTGALGGFAHGVDNWMAPIRNVFKPGQEAEMARMRAGLGDAGDEGMFKGVSKPSQLQGTQFDQGTKIDTPAGLVGAAHLTTLPFINRIPGLRTFAKGVTTIDNGAPLVKAVQRPLIKAVGGGVAARAGLRTAGKFAGPLGAVMQVPDGLQLGDKANDAMGITSKWGRRAVTTGTVGASISAPIAGAALGATIGSAVPVVGTGVGAFVGGLIGSFTPQAVNGTLNHINNNRMIQNQTNARLAYLNGEFSRAMKEKLKGNLNPMKAWYGIQTPEMLKGTIDMNKSNAILQQQMRDNSL
jgi:hypothetical protein